MVLLVESLVEVFGVLPVPIRPGSRQVEPCFRWGILGGRLEEVYLLSSPLQVEPRFRWAKLEAGSLPSDMKPTRWS